ncbi:hypothetical protein COLO4_00545 [Corchorus olitorius]|uniref:Uncharacterized protein n=1 Tax=Corchorus olitorius TaxID=93759 RepID=A0A1R3L3P0_9ROSI|nr:hypothetical protein COLO4_00545 [Corchorus olitorius]
MARKCSWCSTARSTCITAKPAKRRSPRCSPATSFLPVSAASTWRIRAARHGFSLSKKRGVFRAPGRRSEKKKSPQSAGFEFSDLIAPEGTGNTTVTYAKQHRGKRPFCWRNTVECASASTSGQKKQPAQTAGRKSVEESPVLRAPQVYEISCGGSIGVCPDRAPQRALRLLPVVLFLSSFRLRRHVRPPGSHPACGRWRPCCRPSYGAAPPDRCARPGFGGRAPAVPGGGGKTSIRVAWQTSPDQTDGQALQVKLITIQINVDRFEIRILGNQFDMAALALEALDRHVVAKSGHDDLAVGGFGGSLHGQEVAIQNTGVAHAHAAHLQQKIGLRREQRRIDLILAIDVLCSQDRTTGGHAAHQRECQLHQPHRRQRELMLRRVACRPQPNATRGARRQFDHALACQRAQVFLGRIGRREAELRGDLGARGRKARALDRLADQVVNLLLAGGEGGHWRTVYLNRCCDFIQ